MSFYVEGREERNRAYAKKRMSRVGRGISAREKNVRNCIFHRKTKGNMAQGGKRGRNSEYNGKEEWAMGRKGT